ncbi:RcnB family protein [Paracoccus nototheniae]|uniref:RcnB family protein n=1 Tax=Paracoccus nototheniae TaxID=2489002 RepID=A0ABW4E0B0_9RHOB|nr:RcnB family protein [Paracoccus nototheniae]
MTPLHPFAAAAAGAMMGLAALTAPNTPSPRGLDALVACTMDCAGPARPLPAVGAVAPQGQTHRVTRPGRYGLSEPPEGEIYAVLHGQLVRIEAASGIIRSILRPAGKILD